MNYVLKPWQIEYAADLAKNLNNAKIHANLRDLPFPYTVSDGEDYIKSVLAAPKDSQYSWAITVDDKVAGSIGIFRKDNIQFRTAELGYYIAEEHWGKGIMTNSVKEACKFVFENTDILRIFAQPFSRNAASCRVLEKAGFAFEGTLRQNAVKNGVVIDMKMYAILRS